mgnify:CR=1 FL=1
MAALNKGFRLVRRGEVTVLQSPLLAQCPLTDHAFSTRLGGCSSGAMAALNTAFHTGDDRALVLENRRRLLQPFGYEPDAVVAGIQVHGTGVARVTAADRGRGTVPGNFLGQYDALVTTEPGLVLTAYAADCPILFLIEPQRPLIALAHAGWRGTLGGMAHAVITCLQNNYGVDPARLLAAISPCICPNCYHVGEDVAALFRRAGWGEAPYLEPEGPGKFRLDLSRINAAQLREAGIEDDHLAENSWCTSCRPDLFYSYRRENGVTGRMMAFLAIKPQRSRPL